MGTGSHMNKAVVVFEPQCWGFEHSKFNAALLVALQYLYNDVLFISERTHKTCVIKILAEYGRSIESIVTAIPPRKQIGFSRFFWELIVLAKVARIARYKNAKLLLSSCTGQTVACILVLRFLGLIDKKPTIILHSIVESAFKRPSLRFWDIPFWFRFYLVKSVTKLVRYIVLGENISKNIEKSANLPAGSIKYINHPYLKKNWNYKNLPRKNKIVIGFIGVGQFNKGLDNFIALQKENQDPFLEFWVIGYIPSAKIRSIAISAGIQGVSAKPLSDSEFNDRLSSIDYAIYLYNPSVYKFVASGAIFDAITFQKPIIALKNDYFNEFFSKGLDIGYECGSLKDVKTLLNRLPELYKPEIYKQQQKNLNMLFNAYYSLDKIGYSLVSIIEAKK